MYQELEKKAATLLEESLVLDHWRVIRGIRYLRECKDLLSASVREYLNDEKVLVDIVCLKNTLAKKEAALYDNLYQHLLGLSVFVRDDASCRIARDRTASIVFISQEAGYKGLEEYSMKVLARYNSRMSEIYRKNRG